VTVVLGFVVTSEWMIRTYVTPHDNYEYIAERLLSSKEPNAAFGDSHVAAVPDYNTKDFINLGIGATTIRKMNDRVRFYYRNLKPGEVIIQADPHSFAEYRLEAQGSYVPEVYSSFRLRMLDPRHRGFMTEYWRRFLLAGRLTEQPQPGYDQLWQNVGSMILGQPKAAPAQATASAPVQAAAPAGSSAEPPKPEAAAAPAPSASPPKAETATVQAPAAAGASATQPKAATASAEPTAAAAGSSAAALNAKTVESYPSAPAVVSPANVTDAAPAGEASEADREALTKFNAFMDYEVNSHTPVADFRERDEARIYRDLIKFLIARGAKVCLVNYPVDHFYRERADRIPGFAAVRKFYQEVARDNGIPYVSFWDRFKDESMFQNTDHVNQNGSPILAREAREACFGKGGHG